MLSALSSEGNRQARSALIAESEGKLSESNRDRLVNGLTKGDMLRKLSKDEHTRLSVLVKAVYEVRWRPDQSRERIETDRSCSCRHTDSIKAIFRRLERTTLPPCPSFARQLESQSDFPLCLVSRRLSSTFLSRYALRLLLEEPASPSRRKYRSGWSGREAFLGECEILRNSSLASRSRFARTSSSYFSLRSS